MFGSLCKSNQYLMQIFLNCYKGILLGRPESYSTSQPREQDHTTVLPMESTFEKDARQTPLTLCNFFFFALVPTVTVWAKTPNPVNAWVTVVWSPLTFTCKSEYTSLPHVSSMNQNSISHRLAVFLTLVSYLPLEFLPTPTYILQW